MMTRRTGEMTAVRDRLRVLLLHPPLLASVIWGPMAGLLSRQGHDVAAPPLPTEPTGQWWRSARDAALRCCPEPDLVVAHSGAGVLAPLVVAGAPAVRAVVLVEAVMPAASGATAPSAPIRAAVRDLATDGVLPAWPDWWLPQVLAEEVPVERHRRLLRDTSPRLPVSLYDVEVPVPAGWEPAICGYVRLSPAYDDHADEARQRGWQVLDLPGRHLDVLTRPDRVAAGILSLCRADVG